jgi:hypothetical protein
MSSREFSPGLSAALGAVRLTLAHQPPAFRRDGQSVLSVEVEPPGAVIGRHVRADVVLGGGDDVQFVSNFHLLVQPSGGIWVARDNGSSHGTTAHAPSRGQVTLRPQQPLPLVDGMWLELAGVARMSVALIPLDDVLPTLPPRGTTVHIPAWISDPDQQELADLLTEPRRRGTASRITADDVGAQLHWSSSKAHRVRRALAEHREVARHLDGDGQVSFVMLAGALALAFPYLIEPRPDGA